MVWEKKKGGIWTCAADLAAAAAAAACACARGMRLNASRSAVGFAVSTVSASRSPGRFALRRAASAPGRNAAPGPPHSACVAGSSANGVSSPVNT